MKTNIQIIAIKKVITLVEKVFATKNVKRDIDIQAEIVKAASIEYSSMSPEEIKKELRKAFCDDHTGKMHGIWSISTSCLANTRCLARMLNGESICAHCFSASMNGQYDALRVKLLRNTFLLNTVELTPDMVPEIRVKSKMFRFESFGDLLSPLQVKNYFTIAEKANERGVICALWTKNPDIIDKAIKQYGLVKPANLQIIQSTLKVNDAPASVEYEFIDKVFTVYDPEFIEENGININCGARDCSTCRRCYTAHEGIEYISEKLK